MLKLQAEFSVGKDSTTKDPQTNTVNVGYSALSWQPQPHSHMSLYIFLRSFNTILFISVLWVVLMEFDSEKRSYQTARKIKCIKCCVAK